MQRQKTEPDAGTLMDAADKPTKLVDLKFFRQSRGIPERDQLAATLIETVGKKIRGLLDTELSAIGRNDLIPRAMAHALNSLVNLPEAQQPGIANKFIDNTIDFAVAMNIGARTAGYRKLHNYLVKKGITAAEPMQFLVKLPRLGPEFVEVGYIANQGKFKSFGVECLDKTYMVCIDSNHGVNDLHIRECSIKSEHYTERYIGIRQCAALNTRKACINWGILNHMGYDGELSKASFDQGYVCSVWSDADVAGGWVTTKAYLRHESLATITLVLEALGKMSMERKNRHNKRDGER